MLRYALRLKASPVSRSVSPFIKQPLMSSAFFLRSFGTSIKDVYHSLGYQPESNLSSTQNFFKLLEKADHFSKGNAKNIINQVSLGQLSEIMAVDNFNILQQNPHTPTILERLREDQEQLKKIFKTTSDLCFSMNQQSSMS